LGGQSGRCWRCNLAEAASSLVVAENSLVVGNCCNPAGVVVEGNSVEAESSLVVAENNLAEGNCCNLAEAESNLVEAEVVEGSCCNSVEVENSPVVAVEGSCIPVDSLLVGTHSWVAVGSCCCNPAGVVGAERKRQAAEGTVGDTLENYGQQEYSRILLKRTIVGVVAIIVGIIVRVLA